MGCHVLLQGIFPTQELNLSILHCRQILYHLSHLGSPMSSNTKLAQRHLTQSLFYNKVLTVSCNVLSQVALVVKNPPIIAGDTGSIPRSGRSPGGGHGNPLQYSCIENPMDRGTWQTAVPGVAKSWTRLKQLSTSHVMYWTLYWKWKAEWLSGYRVVVSVSVTDPCDHWADREPRLTATVQHHKRVLYHILLA